MPDGTDPWENTKALLGADFFDVEPSEAEVRDAFEAELIRSQEAREPFSVLKFMAGLRGSGLEELAPGVYFGHGGPSQPDDGNGGWVSGAC